MDAFKIFNFHVIKLYMEISELSCKYRMSEVFDDIRMIKILHDLYVINNGDSDYSSHMLMLFVKFCIFLYCWLSYLVVIHD